jgi:hypothetical protein
MTVQTFYVTPSLFVGAIPPGLTDCVFASNFEQALDIICDDRIAVVPLDGWGIVCDMLSVLCLSQHEIEDRVHFGTTTRPAPSC